MRNKPEKFMLFSYGHGVDEVRDMIGDVQVAGAAILRNHKVVFGGMDYMRCKTALPYIVPSNGESTLGLVFVLICEQLNLLDTVIGVHRKLYRRDTLMVEHPCGTSFPAYVYVPVEAVDIKTPLAKDYTRYLELTFTAHYFFKMMKRKRKGDVRSLPCECRVFNPEALEQCNAWDKRLGPLDVPP